MPEGIPNGQMPEVDFNQRERFQRTMGERDAVSAHNLSQIGDMGSLLSRATAGIGNVRGKQATPIAPQVLEGMEQNLDTLTKKRGAMDSAFDSSIQGKRLFEAKLAADKARQGAEQQRGDTARILAEIKGDEHKMKMLQEAAMRDPNSPESMLWSLLASGMGLNLSQTIPGSAVKEVVKPLSYIYGQRSQAEIAGARQAQQNAQFQAGQANLDKRLDKTLSAQAQRDAARLALERDKNAGRIAQDEQLTALKQHEQEARAREAQASREAAAAKSDADRQAKLKIAAEARRSAEAIAKARAAASAASTPKTAAPRPVTDAQRAAAGFAQRLEDVEKNFAEIEAQGYNRASLAAAAQNKLPEALMPEQAKLQMQAERNFVNAVLRRESGAAISVGEFASAEAQYFPRAGDSDAVKAQKKRNRQVKLAELKSAAGASATSDMQENLSAGRNLIKKPFQGQRIRSKTTGKEYEWSPQDDGYLEVK
jgi:hypothetical protein